MMHVESFEEIREIAEEVIVGDIFVEITVGARGFFMKSPLLTYDVDNIVGSIGAADISQARVMILAIDESKTEHAYKIIEVPPHLLETYKIETNELIPFAKLPMGFIAYLAEQERAIGDWAKNQFND